jgi:hypothetical protein
MGRRGERLPVEALTRRARHPPGGSGSQGLDHGLGEPGRVAHEGGGDLRFDAIALMGEDGGRHTHRLFSDLIDSMPVGWPPGTPARLSCTQEAKRNSRGEWRSAGRAQRPSRRWASRSRFKRPRASTQSGRSLTKRAKSISSTMGVTSKRETGTRTPEMPLEPEQSTY